MAADIGCSFLFGLSLKGGDIVIMKLSTPYFSIINKTKYYASVNFMDLPLTSIDKFLLYTQKLYKFYLSIKAQYKIFPMFIDLPGPLFWKLNGTEHLCVLK